MENELIKTTFSKTNSFFLKLAAFSTTALALFGAYTFYKNNIWHPTIEVINIDYANGVAILKINGKEFVLRGDSNYLISYDWGIRFGYTFLANGTRKYDRIEVTKRDMVHEVIRKNDTASSLSFTGFNEQTYWNDAFNQYNSYSPTDNVKR